MVALAIGMLLLGVPQAEARKYCTCVMATGGWNSGVIKNLGHIADYADLDIAAPGKCSKACSDKCSGQAGVNALGGATNACALMGWKSGCVRCYGYIGNIGTNNADGTVGTFTCQAAVTQQKCPRGWVCNGCSPQVDGGVTTDGKCKKVACQPNTISPYPADGTAIGSWGFSWGNAFIAWGTPANGGAPSTIIITPQSASYSPGC
jgi:hypothetical protein